MKNLNYWLANRLNKSRKLPTEQLLHLFEAMEELPAQWLPDGGRKELLQHLEALASQSKIDEPEIFAQQILFMATEAREKQLRQPESDAIQHARIAAKALIMAQTKSHFSRSSHIYAMAASFFLIFGVTSIMFSQELIPPPQEQLDNLLEVASPSALDINNSPKQLSEMLSSREKMRQGTCHFPEALAFAETERGVYLKNVVNGELSLDKKEQEITTRLMKFVRCDYTPMLMKNSIS